MPLFTPQTQFLSSFMFSNIVRQDTHHLINYFAGRSEWRLIISQQISKIVCAQLTIGKIHTTFIGRVAGRTEWHLFVHIQNYLEFCNLNHRQANYKYFYEPVCHTSTMICNYNTAKMMLKVCFFQLLSGIIQTYSMRHFAGRLGCFFTYTTAKII